MFHVHFSYLKQIGFSLYPTLDKNKLNLTPSFEHGKHVDLLEFLLLPGFFLRHLSGELCRLPLRPKN